MANYSVVYVEISGDVFLTHLLNQLFSKIRN